MRKRKYDEFKRRLKKKRDQHFLHFLQHLKKTLLKLFSCLNLFRVGSPRHSLEKNACMQNKRKSILQYSALTVVNTGQLSAENTKSFSMKICCYRTNPFPLTQEILLQEALRNNKKERRNAVVLGKTNAFPFMLISVKEIWHMMYVYVCIYI